MNTPAKPASRDGLVLTPRTEARQCGRAGGGQGLGALAVPPRAVLPLVWGDGRVTSGVVLRERFRAHQRRLPSLRDGVPPAAVAAGPAVALPERELQTGVHRRGRA